MEENCFLPLSLHQENLRNNRVYLVSVGWCISSFSYVSPKAIKMLQDENYCDYIKILQTHAQLPIHTLIELQELDLLQTVV